MNSSQRPALGNVLAILNLITSLYFAGLTVTAVIYRRVGAQVNIDNDLVYSFLAFGMEPPLLLTILILAISVTCILMVLKGGSAGTAGIGLSFVPDLLMVVFTSLTLAQLLPWKYTPQPESVIIPLIAFSILVIIKLILMFRLVGTEFYPRAQ